LGLGNINRFITRRILRKKESSISDNSDSGTSPIPEGNWIIIVTGIVIAAIGLPVLYFMDRSRTIQN
jgi:hypothetical protein